MYAPINAADFFNREEYSDLTIKFSGREIKCHKLILCTKSKYFKALCGPGGRFAESRQNEIVLAGDDPDAFEALLRYIYTFDYVPADKDVGQDWRFHLRMMEVADKYGLEWLEAKAFEQWKAIVEAMQDIQEVLNLISERDRDHDDYVGRHGKLKASIDCLTRKHLVHLIQQPRFRAMLDTHGDLNQILVDRLTFADGLVEKRMAKCRVCKTEFVPANFFACRCPRCGQDGPCDAETCWVKC